MKQQKCIMLQVLYITTRNKRGVQLLNYLEPKSETYIVETIPLQ